MQAVWGSNSGTTTPQCLLLREKDHPGRFVLEGTQEPGGRGVVLGLSQAPSGSGQVGWVGVPCSPGSAKDTRFNVGSHDVTSNVEVDADEFALPTGKHRSRSVPQPQLLTHPAGKWAGRWQGAFGWCGEPQTQSLAGQLVRRNHLSELGSRALRSHRNL